VTRTTVLVDIDGVVNARALTHWPEETWRSRTIYPTSLNDVWRVTWSAAAVNGLREIADMPGVDIGWLTTWTWRARADFAPAIGLGGDWPTSHREDAEAVAVEPDLDWWKADIARDALTSADRVVWIDDHISLWMDMLRDTGPHDRLDWMDPARLLAVRPDARRGMDRRHLIDIRRFILTGERPTA